jgi:hypothetical protein
MSHQKTAEDLVIAAVQHSGATISRRGCQEMLGINAGPGKLGLCGAAAKPGHSGSRDSLEVKDRPSESTLFYRC